MSEYEKDLQHQMFHEKLIASSVNTVSRCNYCTHKNIDCINKPFIKDGEVCQKLKGN